MPVTVSEPYRSYSACVEQRGLDLSRCRCPECVGDSARHERATLVLTRSRVRRTVWGLVRDGCGFRRGADRARPGDRALHAVRGANPSVAVRCPASQAVRARRHRLLVISPLRR